MVKKGEKGAKFLKKVTVGAARNASETYGRFIKSLNFLNLKNIHIITYFMLILISWFVYKNFFFPNLEYEMRFVSAFMLGWLCSYTFIRLFGEIKSW